MVKQGRKQVRRGRAAHQDQEALPAHQDQEAPPAHQDQEALPAPPVLPEHVPDIPAPLAPAHPLEVLGAQLQAHQDLVVEEGWILLPNDPTSGESRTT